MTLKQTLAALKKAGTAQNRKIYARHGVRAEMFGVSYAELKKLRKGIGTDHALARELWATGNHDARVLATMVADPLALTRTELDAWVRALGDYVLTDTVGALAAGSPHALAKARQWKDRKAEFTAACGWTVIAHLAGRPDGLPDDEAEALIAQIRQEIHAHPNRTRHSMNMALIALGVRNETLQEAALAAAARIGRVEVDHGETSCQTPDAAAYIRKTAAHRSGRGRTC